MKRATTIVEAVTQAVEKGTQLIELRARVSGGYSEVPDIIYSLVNDWHGKFSFDKAPKIYQLREI